MRAGVAHRGALLACGLGLVASGCGGLRPASSEDSARFRSFESARAAFAEIVPGATTVDDLRGLRIDPEEAGTRLVNPVRAAAYFTRYPEAPRALQPPAVTSCLAAGARCQAWLVSQERISRRRIGNFLLDVLRFRRLRHTTGWSLEGVVFVLDDVAVYRIWRGKARIDETSDDVRPLGLFQEGPRVEIEGLRRPRLIMGSMLGEEETR
jgi:hypothetical protein